MMRTNKKSGFTLAEVLITLGIIGVVAAMTIPTLIANTNSAKFRAQFKKTLSVLNQSALMATAQYDQDYAGLEAGTCDGSANPEGNNKTLCAVINGTLSGASFYSLNSLKVGATSTAYADPSVSGMNAVNAAYKLADGSMLLFNTGMNGCELAIGADPTTLASSATHLCGAYIDVNGTTLPNKAPKCNGTAGTVSSTVGSCIVKNNGADMGDIFPVIFHDQTVEPITDAARYVLNQAK